MDHFLCGMKGSFTSRIDLAKLGKVNKVTDNAIPGLFVKKATEFKNCFFGYINYRC
ncbi:hypothetical protein NBRC116590_16910 [Pelagimonas sp. KU-00592-HH]